MLLMISPRRRRVDEWISLHPSGQNFLRGHAKWRRSVWCQPGWEMRQEMIQMIQMQTMQFFFQAMQSSDTGLKLLVRPWCKAARRRAGEEAKRRRGTEFPNSDGMCKIEQHSFVVVPGNNVENLLGDWKNDFICSSVHPFVRGGRRSLSWPYFLFPQPLAPPLFASHPYVSSHLLHVSLPLWSPFTHTTEFWFWAAANSWLPQERKQKELEAAEAERKQQQIEEAGKLPDLILLALAIHSRNCIPCIALYTSLLSPWEVAWRPTEGWHQSARKKWKRHRKQQTFILHLKSLLFEQGDFFVWKSVIWRKKLED